MNLIRFAICFSLLLSSCTNYTHKKTPLTERQECIQTTINEQVQKLKFIYEDFLNKSNTDGYILFRFLLLPSGNVDDVSIDSTTVMNSEFKTTLINKLVLELMKCIMNIKIPPGKNLKKEKNQPKIHRQITATTCNTKNKVPLRYTLLLVQKVSVAAR